MVARAGIAKPRRHPRQRPLSSSGVASRARRTSYCPVRRELPGRARSRATTPGPANHRHLVDVRTAFGRDGGRARRLRASAVRIGVLLPDLEVGADAAFDFARRADDAGLDGVFAYDHLWPMGSPTRPSLAPFAVLAGSRCATNDSSWDRSSRGVGLVGTRTWSSSSSRSRRSRRGACSRRSGPRRSNSGPGEPGLTTWRRVAPTSVEPSWKRRRRSASSDAVWFGGGAAATNELARRLGVTINLWDATPERVRVVAATGSVSWAGPVPPRPVRDPRRAVRRGCHLGGLESPGRRRPTG